MEYYTAVKMNLPNAAYDHVVMSENEFLRTSEPVMEDNATFIELKTRQKLNSILFRNNTCTTGKIIF